MKKETARRWWEQERGDGDDNIEEKVDQTPLSIQDQIKKFRSIDKSRQKQKPHRYMEMSEEGNEELQMMVTSPWTFSSPNINAYKYAFNLRCNILFFSSNNNMTSWLLGVQPRFYFIFNR
jgi:hypothetical protein